jgi:hypothetical protein
MTKTTPYTTTATAQTWTPSLFGINAGYIIIQNTHATNDLYIKIGDDTATATNSHIIKAGGSIEINSPNGQIQSLSILGSALGTTYIITNL